MVSEKLTYQQLKDKVKKLEKQIIDIKEIQNENYKNNQLLKILIDTIPSPIFYKDIDFIYRNCNEAFASLILGISKEQIINKSLFDLPDVIPCKLAKIYLQQDTLLFENPGKQEYKAQVKCADGVRRIYMFYKSTVENGHGKVVGIVGIMLDISDLEQRHCLLDEENKQLTSLTYIDPLTNIYNRRKFDKTFSEQLLEAKQNNSVLNFVMIDVDDFKQYNDQYGHLEGDNLLLLIATVLRSRLKRPDDYVFRLGGEEFGLLFYALDELAALKLVDNIRSDVQNLVINLNAYDDIKVTISLGLVHIKYRFDNAQFLYDEADKLMYRAKQSGKNRVISKRI